MTSLSRLDAPEGLDGAVADPGKYRLARLQHRSEFKGVYDRGAKRHGRLMTVFALPNELDCSRLGVAATKKVGGAVERNRLKRRVREVFRRGFIRSGVDVVVIPRQEMIKAPWIAIVDEFCALSKRLGILREVG